jgi:hypothetical protein
MVLTSDQIAELIQSPANGELIKQARKYSGKCNLHVNGKDLDQFFEQIKQYENDVQLQLRKDYSRSNKYLFDGLLRPLDKVFAARGGAKYYNIGGSDYEDETRFRAMLSDVRNGMSLEKWIQKIWLKKRVTDPSGVIMVEVSKSGTFCYPTYKGIYSILDYQYSGTKVEYIIFEPEEVDGVKKYRVVDDLWDYIVIESSTTENGTPTRTFEISTGESFMHGFKYVPAVMISDTEDEIKGYKTSFIDSSIEIAEEVLVDNSVKVIFKFTQGFPAYWEIERQCRVCKGAGKVNNHDCEACDGTGIRQVKDVSDKITVTLDEAGKAGAIPPAGYVSADVTTWVQMNSEADLMEKLLHKTMWGTLALVSEKVYEKATGVISDLQPAYDRLNIISSEAENMEKFLTDTIGRFYFNGAYKGSTIIYGKRFQIESPDQLMEKLTKAKQGLVPWQTVKNIYVEYLQTLYSNDIFEMTRQTKLFKLDIYPIYTTGELKNLGLSLTDIYKKIFFEQWTNTLSVDDLFFKQLEELMKIRDTYINEKLRTDAVLQDDSEPAGAVAS